MEISTCDWTPFTGVSNGGGNHKPPNLFIVSSPVIQGTFKKKKNITLSNLYSLKGL